MKSENQISRLQTKPETIKLKSITERKVIEACAVMLYLYMVWHQQRYIDIMITYISKKWIKMCLSVGRLKAIFVYVFAYSIGVFTLVEKVGASSIFLGTILREVSLWPGPGAVSPTQAGVVTFNSALFKISDVNGVWLKSLELKWKRNTIV